MLVLAIILFVIALAGFGAALFFRGRTKLVREPGNNFGSIEVEDKAPARLARLVSAGVAGLGILSLLFGSFYTQDAGEANVDTVTLNIRNQPVVYAGPEGEQSDQAGGVANGPQITVTDADGVTSNIDISLRYSIRPGSVTDIYEDFGSEENFKKSFIEQDVRSVVRQVPNGYTTLDLITKRAEVENKILEALEKRWEDDGVTVTSISLQEIRLPDSVKESYAEAQKAEISVSAEESKLAAEEVKAQQKVVNAKAEADANALLNQSLTPQILQQRYLDTLKELAAKGNLVVVPEGFNGLVNVSK
jgi:regulator of protease activity HflC (stomatin/prohibitin superfamily)